MKKLTRTEIRRLINEEVSSMNRPRRRSLTSLMFEDADPSKIEDTRFPLTLSAVNKELASKIVTGGTEDKDTSKDDDTVQVVKGTSYACQDLNPSQTSMNIDKAMQFALSMINGSMPGSGGPGGDLGSFVSSDNYIMDGHHRWISTFMVDPSAKIIGIKVNLPGPKLVAVLNTITKGMHGIEGGNPGTGGFDQFKNAGAMKAAVEKQMSGSAGDLQGPIGGKQDSAGIKEILKKWCGEQDDAKVVDAAVAKMMQNLSAMPTEIMPGAPDRKDMPVIDDKKVAKATDNTITALQTGQVDLNPPYQKESISKSDNLVMERWQKLAGILKG
jgi:hypothetical protein